MDRDAGSEQNSEADAEELTVANNCFKYHTRHCPINRAILALLLISLLERYAFLNRSHLHGSRILHHGRKEKHD